MLVGDGADPQLMVMSGGLLVKSAGGAGRIEMVWVQMSLLDDSSVTVQVRVIVRAQGAAPTVWSLLVRVLVPQPLVAVAVPVAVGLVDAPQLMVTSAGHVMVGGWQHRLRSTSWEDIAI